ncbi:hypothetical protein RF11_12936 [Thelohanellus kitauei]|uniref:Retrotransposon gag domain-containing protein n=1 Tax=Thelohanellus kitauei TaxID=669202 RepID=A0A0C2IHH8_THEKT|nr:hypothetical protein RF11_12936 [Thelohanellus kitauei]
MNPNLSNFKHDAFSELKETWTSYKQRFLRALKIYWLHPVTDPTKVLIFLHSAGPEINNILTTHFHLQDLDWVPFSEILSCLKLHYEPKRPLLLRSIDFQNRKRQLAKKVEPFHISLKTIASKCEFGNQTDKRIRDQLIFGIENDAL